MLGRPLAWHGLHELAAAEHTDPVGDLEHLVQLVADEDHGHAFADERAEDLEELSRLLRRQHGRRLVEDQDVRSAIERLEDLDPLLLADADVLDTRLRVDREAETVRQFLHALLRRAVVEEDRVRRRLVAEDDVLGDGHHRDEHEVLVHHADAVGDRVLRRVKGHRLPVDQDLPLVGPIQAVEDVHQRRLPGAVLP